MDECLRDARGEAGGGGTHPGRASGGARDVGDRIKGGKKGGKGVHSFGQVEDNGGRNKGGREGRRRCTCACMYTSLDRE